MEAHTMTPAEVLLKERRDDLEPYDGFGPTVEGYPTPANVRRSVDHLLSSAYNDLWHDDTHYADKIAADAHIIVAINLLNAYRTRLAVWDDLDEAEKMLKLGATKDDRGGWALPEPEGEAPATA
jgi:hypothetical protein